MIDGHGDDAYKYGQKIRINFSSNVYNHVNHNGLREHLYHRMESIRSYPEPEPYSLEQALAHSLHLYGSHLFDSPNLQGEKFCHPDAYFQ